MQPWEGRSSAARLWITSQYSGPGLALLALRPLTAALCLRITDKLDAKNTRCDSDFVTQATQKLLDEFEALPERDRSELVAELARRVALAPHDLPQDSDLVAAADRLFAELDRREQPE